MNVRLALVLLSSVLSFSIEAAVHVWTGATSDRFSEQSNWIGGSPAGDPAAELSFPDGPARRALTNDIAGLTIRTISFSGAGYTVGGQAITIAERGQVADTTTGLNEIAADLVLTDGLTIASMPSLLDGELRFSGALRGAGDVAKIGPGNVTFSGTRANDYTGTTSVLHGSLRLTKSAGVTAIAGNLVIGGSGTSEGAEVIGLTSEQIADSATIHIGGTGRFATVATETIGPLVLAAGSELDTGILTGNVSRSIGRIILAGDVELRGGSSSRVRIPAEIAMRGMRTITICASCPTAEFRLVREATPGSGLIVHAEQPSTGGIVVASGSYRGPTVIKGATASVDNPLTAVRMRDGRFGGSVASLVAEGGEVANVTTAGDLRLGGWTIVRARANGTPTLIAGGNLDLGGATLDLQTDHNTPRVLGRKLELVRKTSSGPVRGTFSGVREGELLLARFALSYSGGDGNDVMLTEGGRYQTAITIGQVAEPLRDGDTVRLPIHVLSGEHSAVPVTGTVRVHSAGNLLGSATLDNTGRATVSFPARHGLHELVVTYEGNSTFAPVEVRQNLIVRAKNPTITSVEPNTFAGATMAEGVLRGSGFLPGGSVVIGSEGHQPTSVTDTEVRFTWTVPRYDQNVTAELHYAQPAPGASPSNTVPVTITAAPLAKSELTLDNTGISGRVVPGGSAAWMMVGRNGPSILSDVALTSDSDGDGVTRWQPARLAVFGVWLMTDMTDGRIFATNRDGNVPPPMPFPRAMFVRDANGRYSHIVLNSGLFWDLLWVRPGVGAWSYRLTDASARDLDGVQNGYLVFNVTSMTGVGTSPVPAPAGVERGDVFLGITSEREDLWFGDRVDEHLAEADGPGTLRFASSTPFRAEEKNGVARVTIMRVGGSDGTVSLNYATVTDSAIAGMRYQNVAGTLVFGPGEILQTIEVPLVNDDTYSGEALFRVRLSAPAGTGITGESTAVVSIVDDELPPRLTASNISIDEGGDGVRTVQLPVTLSGAITIPITARYTISGDIGSVTSGTITFLPGGPRTQTITVAFEGNRIPDGNRLIRISVSYGQFSSQIEQTITIVDDDFAAITVLDTTVIESTRSVAVLLSVTSPTSKEATVSYTTVSGTATAEADFTTTTGTARFGRFGSTAMVIIPIAADTVDEGDESFRLVLSNPTNATLARDAATIIIRDARVLPSLHAAPVLVNDVSDISANVRVMLSSPTTRDVRFRVRTVAGTATENADYRPLDRVVTIAAGQTDTVVSAQIIGDSAAEGTETFSIAISEADGATIVTPNAVVTIVDVAPAPAAPPALTVSDAQIAEGNAGTSTLRFTVRLTTASATPVTVAYATADGSAVAGSDYLAASGSITFAPGETAKTIEVVVRGDTDHESDETFTLVVGGHAGTARITNDDAAPVRRRSAR